MRKFATCRILLLALLLTVSNVALAVHTTAHSGKDMGQCALCISHAKSSPAAVHSCYVGDYHISGTSHLVPLETGEIHGVALLPYQTRAPPFIF